MSSDTVGPVLAKQTLQRGARIVSAAVDRLPGGPVRDQARAVRDAFDQIVWGEVVPGGAIQAMPGPQQTMTDVVVALVPDGEARRLGHPEAFQTSSQPDGNIHVYVRTKRLTPLWAGLILFHELAHVHDFRSGVEPRDPSPDEWLAGELRAYRLEAALLDVVVQGRLTEALGDFLATQSASQLGAGDLAGPRGQVVAEQLMRHALRPDEPPASPTEAGLRGGALLVAALLAIWFDQPDLAGIERPEQALPAMRHFTETYRPHQSP